MALATSVAKTLRYAAFFHYPLDLKDLHFWLISKNIVSQHQLSSFAPTLSSKERLLRQRHTQFSIIKKKQAERFSAIVKFFPTIRLIALTGSAAINNAVIDDDIDLMIVTSANTLWLTRLIIYSLLRLFFRPRRPYCLNLWLDTTALEIPPSKQTLYTAHEVLQIKPLFDRGATYANFILSNSWTSNYLANAYAAITTNLTSPGKIINQKSHILTVINHLAFVIQYQYMKAKITREYITSHAAYFHPRDYSLEINIKSEA